MASTSERTFGNKLEHSRSLHVALSKIVGYKPDNPILELPAFEDYLDTVEGGNDAVASAGQPLSDRRNARRIAFFGDAKGNVGGLPTLAGRVRDFVGAMPGGKKSPSYKQIPTAGPKNQQLSSAEETGHRSTGHAGREQKGDLTIGSQLRLDGAGRAGPGRRRGESARLQPEHRRSPAGRAHRRHDGSRRS